MLTISVKGTEETVNQLTYKKDNERVRPTQHTAADHTATNRPNSVQQMRRWLRGRDSDTT